MIISSLVRGWLRKNPELVLTFDVDEHTNAVVLRAWNPEKTRILKQAALSAEQQTNLIVRLLPLIDGGGFL